MQTDLHTDQTDLQKPQPILRSIDFVPGLERKIGKIGKIGHFIISTIGGDKKLYAILPIYPILPILRSSVSTKTIERKIGLADLTNRSSEHQTDLQKGVRYGMGS